MTRAGPDSPLKASAPKAVPRFWGSAQSRRRKRPRRRTEDEKVLSCHSTSLATDGCRPSRARQRSIPAARSRPSGCRARARSVLLSVPVTAAKPQPLTCTAEPYQALRLQGRPRSSAHKVPPLAVFIAGHDRIPARRREQTGVAERFSSAFKLCRLLVRFILTTSGINRARG
jgi:hypothetical protein